MSSQEPIVSGWKQIMPTARKPLCAVVIVTHNSAADIPQTIECLNNQTVAFDQVILVDSASTDTSYLAPYANMKNMTLFLSDKNLGFCEGNNVGFAYVNPLSDYVLFLNPDAFLQPDFLEKALIYMEQAAHKRWGALTGILLGYDRHTHATTHKYDSTGVFSTWYGKWYDRDQGRLYSSHDYQKIIEIPAICGALMFCRKAALDEVLLNGEVFDANFFMYKEDIDLSLRLVKAGWKLMLCPDIMAYHCRGWALNRKSVPRKLRLQAAKNELRLHLRCKAPIKILYSLTKLLCVYSLDM